MLVSQPIVRPRESDGALDFVVLTRREDDGTWTAWLRDDDAVRATGASRDEAARAVVDAVVDSALATYRVVQAGPVRAGRK